MAPDVPIPYPSGASVHVSELAKGLSAAGHEVYVVARRLRRSERPTEMMKGVNVQRVYRLIFAGQPERSRPGGARDEQRTGFAGRFYYAYLVTLFALYVSLVVSLIVKKNKIDAILERETSFGAGGIASLITGRPLVLEIIGPRFSRLSARRSSKVLYYTETMLNGRVEKEKCVSVSAGVNLSVFRNDSDLGKEKRRKLGLAESDRVVGYVGTFQDWHGVDTLLLSIAQVLKKGIAIKAILVGPNFQEYIEKARNLGVLEYCNFAGPVDYSDVPAYINACDIMVAPYNPNANPLRKTFGIGSPLKLFEYMACEKPLISTNVEPIRGIPSIGEVGILVEPGDSDGLANGIIELAGNEAERERMGSQGRRLAERGYSWGPISERISSVIQAA